MKAELIDWDGKHGKISYEIFRKSFPDAVMPAEIEVISSKTGRSIRFSRYGLTYEYHSNATGEFIFEITQAAATSVTATPQLSFPFRVQSDLVGRRFCVTGTLSVGRSAVTHALLENQAEYHSRILSTTDYLVVGQTAANDTSKLSGAKAKGIPLVDGELFVDFLEFINGGPLT